MCLLYDGVPTFGDRSLVCLFFFFFQAEDGIRDLTVTGVQTCALPISPYGVDRPARERCDPREPLQKVERDPLTGEQGAGRAADDRERRAGVRPGSEIGRASCRERV